MSSSPAEHVSILILAAGASSRMRGQDKLMMEIDGTPILRRQALAACAAAADVVVTVPDPQGPRARTLADLSVQLVTVPDAAKGMSVSIIAGVDAIATASRGVLIVPADMPDLSADDFRIVISAFLKVPDRVARAATPDGIPGHPVVFPRSAVPNLMRLTGDAGARSLVSRSPTILVPLSDARALVDLDTPEDWSAWRAARMRGV